MTKLKSSRGATLIFAMVALAVSVIICAVVIYAAESNAGRIRSAQASEQAQLTLNSAASVVRRSFAGNGILMEKTTKKTTTVSVGVTTVEKSDPELKVYYSSRDSGGRETTLAVAGYTEQDGLKFEQNDLSQLQSILLNWAMDIFNNKAKNTDDCTGTYTVHAAVDGVPMDDVCLYLRMEPGSTPDLTSQDQKENHDAEKFYLTARFSIDTGDEMVPARSEVITISMMATVHQETSVKSGKPVTSTVDDGKGNSVSIETREEITAETLELKWLEENIVVNVVEIGGD